MGGTPIRAELIRLEYVPNVIQGADIGSVNL